MSCPIARLMPPRKEVLPIDSLDITSQLVEVLHRFIKLSLPPDPGCGDASTSSHVACRFVSLPPTPAVGMPPLPHMWLAGSSLCPRPRLWGCLHFLTCGLQVRLFAPDPGCGDASTSSHVACRFVSLPPTPAVGVPPLPHMWLAGSSLCPRPRLWGCLHFLTCGLQVRLFAPHPGCGDASTSSHVACRFVSLPPTPAVGMPPLPHMWLAGSSLCPRPRLWGCPHFLTCGLQVRLFAPHPGCGDASTSSHVACRFVSLPPTPAVGMPPLPHMWLAGSSLCPPPRLWGCLHFLTCGLQVRLFAPDPGCGDASTSSHVACRFVSLPPTPAVGMPPLPHMWLAGSSLCPDPGCGGASTSSHVACRFVCLTQTSS